MKKIILSLIVLSVITISCKSKKKSTETKKINITEMTNNEFAVIKINGISEIKNNPTMVFDFASNKISGSSACNHYNGSFTTEEDSMIKFNTMMSTKRYCREFAKIESSFYKSLAQVTHYEIKGKQILLYDKLNSVMIVGEPKK